MYKVIISSLDGKIRFTSYKTGSEEKALNEFNRQCDIMSKNIRNGSAADQMILLELGGYLIRKGEIK